MSKYVQYVYLLHFFVFLSFFHDVTCFLLYSLLLSLHLHLHFVPFLSFSL